jgi:allantoin racemase
MRRRRIYVYVQAPFMASSYDGGKRIACGSCRPLAPAAPEPQGNGMQARKREGTKDTKPIRLRWINPVGTPESDQPIADLIAPIKRPDTQVEVVSLQMDYPLDNLEYRTYEALVTGDIVRVTRDAAESGFDGVIIGCFYDTALLPAREISGDAVVVGPAQASVEIARNLANKFSVIVGERKWIDEMEAVITSYGYRRSLSSMRPIGLRVKELQEDPRWTKRLILEQARRAIDEDFAEVIVLGCTIEYGFYADLQQILGVPVIDCALAAFKSAEYLAGLKRQLGWRPSRAWGGKPPPEEEVEALGLFSRPAPIGNRVEV